MDSLTYIVLDDSFQKTIENQTEKFTFKGYNNDLEVVNEVFTIGADKCHIYYIDGKQEVSL
jgi:frataxin-like iron-binding protein CyaY